MGANWVRSWAGGRVRIVEGREVFVLEKQWAGVRRIITLDAATETEAEGDLSLWRRDPDKFKTKKQVAEEEALTEGSHASLDTATTAAFIAHARSAGKSELYVRDILEHYLEDWAEAFKGRELRTLRLADLTKRLDKWETGRKHRIITIKAFTKWLRSRGTLSTADDPTIDLAVPNSKSNTDAEDRGYTAERVERVYAEVGSQATRDVLCLRVHTGMHHTEIDRMARGKGRLKTVNDPSGITGTVKFVHKNGRPKIISLNAQCLAAAQRLQTRGRAPSKNSVQSTIDSALRRLGDEVPFDPSNLRHTFITLARANGKIVRPKGKQGLSLEEIADAAGHTNILTTGTYYLGDHVPPMVVVPVSLHHENDPQLPRRENRPEKKQTVRAKAASGGGAKVIPLRRPARKQSRG